MIPLANEQLVGQMIMMIIVPQYGKSGNPIKYHEIFLTIFPERLRKFHDLQYLKIRRGYNQCLLFHKVNI